MQQNGEPSVEEILESIKKVIARDNRESAQSARERRDIPTSPAAEEANHSEDEVLELDEIGVIEEFEEEDEAETSLESEPESLTTENAANAMRDSLAALAMIAEPSRPPQIVRAGETSLEGLTRELLKPILAEWLDANLPEIVERLVKKEIARIAGKKG